MNVPQDVAVLIEIVALTRRKVSFNHHYLLAREVTLLHELFVFLLFYFLLPVSSFYLTSVFYPMKLLYVVWRYIPIYTCDECGRNASLATFKT